MGRPKPIEPRAYVAGRIRDGITMTHNAQGKAYKRPIPKAVDYWIFTSPDERLIQQLQVAYGGRVEKWNEPKANPPNQWRLITDTDRISVWLPADALDTQWELWAGRTCERRCDGTDCWYQAPSGDRTKMDCLCAGEDGSPMCKPRSRLNVMLPAANLAGVWRFDTNSSFFAHEAPAMIRVIEQLAASRAISRVDLVLTKRRIVTRGETADFIVPTLQISDTPEAILSGAAAVGPALGQGVVQPEMRELMEPKIIDSIWHTPMDDDEILDAEILDEPMGTVVEFPKRTEEDSGPQGWDQPPPGVAVRLNPDRDKPGQPRYVKKT